MKNSIINTPYFKNVARSFDISSDYHIKNQNEYENVPIDILSDEELELLYEIRIDSGLKEYKKFLNPKKGKKLLDIGCYLNLIFYKYYLWPSEYYGIDISENVIHSLKDFITKKKIKIGGLECASVDSMPYSDAFFDYVSCINVVEYFTKSYTKIAFKEIYRVMKPEGKFVVDIPNPKHPCFPVMLKVEKFFKRENKFLYGEIEFEKLIENKFEIIDKDSENLMVKYFLVKK